jgi:hypothetical protein
MATARSQWLLFASALHRERREFSISIATSGGFTLTHCLGLDVGIDDCVPRFGAGSSSRFRGLGTFSRQTLAWR